MDRPRFRVLGDPYGAFALDDEGGRNLSPYSAEDALLLAINTLAAELKETRAELEVLKKRVPGE